MTVVQVIRELILSMPQGFTFLHADRPEQNLGDDVVFPIAYLDFPIESDDTHHKTGALTAKYSIKILFADKSELDWLTDQHETNCIEPMRNAARKFIVIMQKDERIGFVTGSKRLDVKNLFDVNMSGCLLTLNFEVVDVDSICL